MQEKRLVSHNKERKRERGEGEREAHTRAGSLFTVKLNVQMLSLMLQLMSEIVYSS